jgi:hypothetical protein
MYGIPAPTDIFFLKYLTHTFMKLLNVFLSKMLEELVFEKRSHKKYVYNYVTVKDKVIIYRNTQMPVYQISGM